MLYNGRTINVVYVLATAYGALGLAANIYIYLCYSLLYFDEENNEIFSERDMA